MERFNNDGNYMVGLLESGKLELTKEQIANILSMKEFIAHVGEEKIQEWREKYIEKAE